MSSTSVSCRRRAERAASKWRRFAVSSAVRRAAHAIGAGRRWLVWPWLGASIPLTRAGTWLECWTADVAGIWALGIRLRKSPAAGTCRRREVARHPTKRSSQRRENVWCGRLGDQGTPRARCLAGRGRAPGPDKRNRRRPSQAGSGHRAFRPTGSGRRGPLATAPAGSATRGQGPALGCALLRLAHLPQLAARALDRAGHSGCVSHRCVVQFARPYVSRDRSLHPAQGFDLLA